MDDDEGILKLPDMLFHKRPTLPEGEPRTLAETYATNRKRPITLSLLSEGSRRNILDDLPLEDLMAGADEILLENAARMAIFSVGRVDKAVNDWYSRDPGRSLEAYDDEFKLLLQERDDAAAYYTILREKLARIQHLEDIRQRGKILRIQKPRMPRMKTKPVKNTG